MLIITMTTVGFGDLTPKTMMGRFCVGITAIVGIFLMALFISLVNEALMLQRREKRILAYVENQGANQKLFPQYLNISLLNTNKKILRQSQMLFSKVNQLLVAKFTVSLMKLIEGWLAHKETWILALLTQSAGTRRRRQRWDNVIVTSEAFRRRSNNV